MNELKNIEVDMLLLEYKKIVRRHPGVFAPEKELDDYYEKVHELEREIKRRINENV